MSCTTSVSGLEESLSLALNCTFLLSCARCRKEDLDLLSSTAQLAVRRCCDVSAGVVITMARGPRGPDRDLESEPIPRSSYGYICYMLHVFFFAFEAKRLFQANMFEALLVLQCFSC